MAILMVCDSGQLGFSRSEIPNEPTMEFPRSEAVPSRWRPPTCRNGAQQCWSLRDSERVVNRLKIPSEKKRSLSESLSGRKGTSSGSRRKCSASPLKAVNFLEPHDADSNKNPRGKKNAILPMQLVVLPFVEHVYVTYDEKREGFSSQSQSTLPCIRDAKLWSPTR